HRVAPGPVMPTDGDTLPLVPAEEGKSRCAILAAGQSARPPGQWGMLPNTPKERAILWGFSSSKMRSPHHPYRGRIFGRKNTDEMCPCKMASAEVAGRDEEPYPLEAICRRFRTLSRSCRNVHASRPCLSGSSLGSSDLTSSPKVCNVANQWS